MQKKSGLISAFVGITTCLDRAAINNKLEPPTNKQIVRNHQTGISLRAVFINGQLSPHKSVSAVSSIKPLKGIVSEAEFVDVVTV